MVKTAVCYFSGSGNSFDISLELCKYIDVESVFYIPNINVKKLEDFEEIIIVTPVYKCSIPKNVQDFIRALKSDCRYFVVLNYRIILGKSKSMIKKLFKQNSLKLASIKPIKMPTSYSIVFPQPAFAANILLGRAKRKSRRIARFIKNNENKNLNLKNSGKIKRYVGYSLISNYLSAGPACTKCEECIDICPSKNISLYQGKIEFGSSCLGCLACYNRCEHILYKNKKRKTYINPHVDFRLMK